MNPIQLRNIQLKKEAAAEGLSLTAHAIDRMLEMRVTPADLGEAYRHGSSYPVRSQASGRIGVIHFLPGADWAVVEAGDEQGLVVTVVFRTLDEYVREGAGFRPV